jgi:hypothetical protein
MHFTNSLAMRAHLSPEGLLMMHAVNGQCVFSDKVPAPRFLEWVHQAVSLD